jgi:uncharacterized repeat protein (TIGR03803 family)
MAVILTTLVSFNGTNGANPDGGLIFDANGNLLGTTALSDIGLSNPGHGTVFEIVKTGANTYASIPTTLVDFNGTSGALPQGSLIADANGDLFGTTSGGGNGLIGTVFEIVKTGNTYASIPTTLVDFRGASASPFGSLIFDANGDLFGTTEAGGANGDGTVFEIVKTGANTYASTPTTLVDFNGTNGDAPHGDLIFDANGDLFGTTSGGGANNDGTVFEIVKTGANTYASTPTTLVDFNGTNGDTPYGSLIADANGDLFGTTAKGGANGFGTVFEIVKTGANTYASTPTTLVSFKGANGAFPEGNLIFDANGDLFGTTSGGGANNDGTVFEIVKTGNTYASTPTTLVDFNGTNGAAPFFGSLIFDANGNLFGTTGDGGANNDGTVFEISFTETSPPIIVRNNTLSVTVGMTATISANYLAFSDPDNSDDQLTYTILTQPSDGTLLKSGSATSSFTQADIDNGLISYHETTNNVSSDLFTFYVSDPAGNKTGTETFQFQISDITPPVLVRDSTLSVGIGATATISASNYLAFSDPDNSDDQLTYTILTQPSDGTLLKSGSATSSFTQTDIDNGLISYHETTNNVSSDLFAFYASDTAGNKTAIQSFQIQISPPSNPLPNPPPPPGMTAAMVLRNGSGNYEIYDIGNNAILAGYSLGQVGTDWQFVGLGRFFGSDTTDMLLRSASTGGFEVYDIGNNNITNAAFMGTVGLDWQVTGFGDFSGTGDTDMMLRNANTGGIEVYDIRNNQIIGASFMGTVGLTWQVGGFGNFSSRGTSDMLMRNTLTGGLQVYEIDHNQITGSAFMGTVGLDWQASGIGNFSSIPGQSDMILRNTKTGGLELYNIANNQITGAAFLGTVGLEWQFAGVAPVHGPGASDLVLRNVNSGQFEVYDIANNQITGAGPLGAVGLDWQLGGFAADPSTALMGGSTQVGQLVQAMAGFGGGAAADTSNTVPLGAETSQQQFLTTPQHA